MFGIGVVHGLNLSVGTIETLFIGQVGEGDKRRHGIVLACFEKTPDFHTAGHPGCRVWTVDTVIIQGDLDLRGIRRQRLDGDLGGISLQEFPNEGSRGLWNSRDVGLEGHGPCFRANTSHDTGNREGGVEESFRTLVEVVNATLGHCILERPQDYRERDVLRREFMSHLHHRFNVQIRGIKDNGMSQARQVVLWRLEVFLGRAQDHLHSGYEQTFRDERLLGLWTEGCVGRDNGLHKGHIAKRGALGNNVVRHVNGVEIASLCRVVTMSRIEPALVGKHPLEGCGGLIRVGLNSTWHASPEGACGDGNGGISDQRVN